MNITKVNEELAVLHEFAGREPQSVLISIDWDTSFTFSNGCKAPPWRQVFGDIGYLVVVPKDSPKFYVTASKKGYFINKGYVKDSAGREQLDYDPESPTVTPVYSSLIELLKARSAHFSQTIDKQKYKYLPEEKKGKIAFLN